MRKIRFASIYLFTLAVVFFVFGVSAEWYTIHHTALVERINDEALDFLDSLNLIFFFLGFLALCSIYFAEKMEVKTLSLAYTDLQNEISERKWAEETLRKSEDKFRTLTNNLNVGVYRNTPGPQGKFIEANPAIVKMFGFENREEFLAVNVSDLYQDSPDRVKSSDKLAKEGFVRNEELRLKKKDKTLFIGSVSAVAVKDQNGEIQFYDGIIEDITENKRADEALIKSERWYRTLAQIGLSLSAEKDINKLLEMIVVEARDLTNADAGTLYILDKSKQSLVFEIVQNDSMQTKMGGISGVEVNLPSVPLYINGEPNYSNVSSYVALTGKTVNFPDVYKVEGLDFPGPRDYDALTGYRSKSMLVIALQNHENEIIGVLQLLNAQDSETGEVVPFSDEYVDLIASLASQAAVALTNAHLVKDLNNLFYAFIKSIATAIDEKSPYTGGHIKRVVDLSMMIAEKINEAKEGLFKDIYFSKEEMEELRLAAWMHDVGKITTPEYVVNKASRLQTIFDRIHFIETRFALITSSITNIYLDRKIELLNQEKINYSELHQLDKKPATDLMVLRQEFEFIKVCNDSDSYITEDDIERLKQIGNKTYCFQDEEHPYLTEDELTNLFIRKSTLTDEERKVVENHVTMTLKMLKELPFPWKMSKVPEYAGGHHEKLDGSGYPLGLLAKDLPLQTRILAVVDIFEALTAKDRPYRKPINLSQVIKIMGSMKENNHIDPDIYDLLFKSDLYYNYVKKEMDPKQIDV